MPKPTVNETKKEFISRCISVVSKEEDKEDWDKDKIIAYCYSLWREKDSSIDIIKEFFLKENADVIK